ncbi:MAG: hypothetical protein VXW43_19925, partial [Pseudomonadota bacterium]|nr:hypothetical protein [Pseudomonadota bacterium]
KAAWNNSSADVFRALVEAGADANAKDNDGKTPEQLGNSAFRQTLRDALTAAAKTARKKEEEAARETEEEAAARERSMAAARARVAQAAAATAHEAAGAEASGAAAAASSRRRASVQSASPMWRASMPSSDAAMPAHSA